MTATATAPENGQPPEPVAELAEIEHAYYDGAAPAKHPHVIAAIAAVALDVGVIGKERRGPDKQGGFAYRGIEDVMNALHRPLSQHGVVIAPRVVEHTITPLDRPGWHKVTITTEFDVYGPNGPDDKITTRITADGDDNADKGYGKALSYCYKSMAAQLFSLPTEDVSIDNEAPMSASPVMVAVGSKQHAELMGMLKALDGDAKADVIEFCTRLECQPKTGAGLTVDTARMIANVAGQYLNAAG